MNTQNYNYLADCVEITIHKPLYGTFCYIRDSHLNYARKHGIPLRITVPQGTAIVTVEQWMKDAKRIEKVFLRPDEPMVLWGNSVPVTGYEQKKQEKKEVKKEPIQTSLF